MDKQEVMAEITDNDIPEINALLAASSNPSRQCTSQAEIIRVLGLDRNGIVIARAPNGCGIIAFATIVRTTAFFGEILVREEYQGRGIERALELEAYSRYPDEL